MDGALPFSQTPALFVSGERDGFGSSGDGDGVEINSGADGVVDGQGAGHELLTSRNRADLPGRVVDAFLEFAKQ